MFLSNFVPFILSANIRGWIDENAYYISEGIGQEGDLILVETIENSPVFQIMNNKEETLYSNECRYILSVLGNRESSTHVCGGIPPEGLTIFKGMEIDWIGGASGVIGKCYETKEIEKYLNVEISFKVLCIGLVLKNGKPINVMDFSIQPILRPLKLPIIFFGASSAEAGKTTLMCKSISLLSDMGTKVAAIKATGTGGVLDCLSYKKAGAQFYFDQVDCGIITTYTSKEKFQRVILKAFLMAQDKGADIIVCEMGGDFIGGNNTNLFEIKQINDQIIALFFINNDPLALLGMKSYVSQLKCNFPIFYFSSPFRNFLGMKERATSVGNVALWDINDSTSLKRILEKIASTVNLYNS